MSPQINSAVSIDENKTDIHFVKYLQIDLYLLPSLFEEVAAYIREGYEESIAKRPLILYEFYVSSYYDSKEQA